MAQSVSMYSDNGVEVGTKCRELASVIATPYKELSCPAMDMNSPDMDSC